MKLVRSLPALVLLLAIALRGLLLEYSDLIDPTEARYAAVAEEMVLRDDWVTPRLPMPEGVVPYLGKPPLHFWLTAASYRLFGIDEWTARLPSFIANGVILVVVMVLALGAGGWPTAFAAALILFSSVMTFFLAGASVVDVTLSAWITLGLLCLYRAATVDPVRYGLGAVVAMACAFLTKGPIGVVLTMLPYLIWCGWRRDLTSVRRLPWGWGMLLFLVLVTPWFVILETRNPGAAWYFFWNENVARFLMRDYGDLYGSGHVEPHGMAWLFWMVNFLPWTFVLAWSVVRLGRSKLREMIRETPALAFFICWAVSAPLFFTFVRQLHAMYILPAMPGLALVTAVLCGRAFDLAALDRYRRAARMLGSLCLGIWAILLIVAAVLEFQWPAMLLGLALAAGGGAVLRRTSRIEGALGPITGLAAGCLTAWFVGLAALTPHVDIYRSAEVALRRIAAHPWGGSTPPHVGVIGHNTYSPNWAAGAWQSELSRQVSIVFLTPGVVSPDLDYLMVKSKQDISLPPEFNDFHVIGRSGRWLLFSRAGAP